MSCIYALQSIFLLGAFLLRYHNDMAVFGVYGLICASILSFFYWARRSNWRLRPAVDTSDRRKSLLRRFDGLYWGARRYIEIAIIAYLWVMIVVIFQSYPLFSAAKPVFLLSLVLAVLLALSFKSAFLHSLVKLCIYITATFSGFILTSTHLHHAYVDATVNGFLAVLMAVIFLGTRVTRKVVFSFSTQDLLISLFAVATVLLADTEFPVIFLFRLLCLAYGIEYLLNFPNRSYKLLKLSALTSGAMVCVVLLQGFNPGNPSLMPNLDLSHTDFRLPRQQP